MPLNTEADSNLHWQHLSGCIITTCGFSAASGMAFAMWDARFWHSELGTFLGEMS